MQQVHIGRRGIIIGLIICIIIGGIGWFTYQGSKPTLSKRETNSAVTIAKPELVANLAQTVLITPNEGGVVRTIDDAGIVSILRIPAGAVENEVSITVTPFATNTHKIDSGVSITPEDVVFKVPVTLSFNWYLSKNKSSQKRPFPVRYDTDSEMLTLTPIQRALVVRNHMPALITTGGFYGVTDDAALVTEVAKQTIAEENSTLETLDAGLTISAQNKLSSGEQAILKPILETILAEEKPDINELYLAIMLEGAFSKSVSWISKAQAYGLIDGYLQFRCNLPEVTYEDAMIAMDAAAQRRYTDVAETCKKRAEKLLIERAKLVDADPNRPLIDAVEVLQQMQALGLTDAGSPGAEIAQRLHNDVQATLHRTSPDVVDDEPSGRIRSNSASTDPLLKHNSTLIEEMLGIEVTRLVGLESFDEAGLKNLGDTTHKMLTDFTTLTGAMCDLARSLPGFESMGQFGDLGEFNKRCAQVQNGSLQKGIDMLEVEIDEYAEGVDAVQNDRTPDAGWDESVELEQYMKQFEN